MAEPSEQDRMTARQHTAQLLKMLRGAGSGAVPPVAANGMPAARQVAAAAKALRALWRPGKASATSALPSGATSSRRVDKPC